MTHPHSAVQQAIKKGTLVRQPCEVCGREPGPQRRRVYDYWIVLPQVVQAHHDDYSKPLDVRWLCYIHHNEHHQRERASA